DNNALIEFNAPRRVGTAEETVQRNLAQLLEHAASPVNYLAGGADRSERGDAQLLTEAALGAVKRGDRQRAEQLVGYSLEHSETAQGHSMLGELQNARGDESGAIESWQAALTLDPNHFYTLINLGKLFLTKQDTAHAVPYLDHALQVDPVSARA